MPIGCPMVRGGYYLPPVETPVERRMPHVGHRQHLCDIAERGEIALEQMKDLVRDAKFICRKCGRAAAREENLCEPEPL